MRKNMNLSGRTITTTFVILLVATPTLAQTEISNFDTCFNPLGMESGQIADEDLHASSAYSYKSVGPQFARLNTESGDGAWCPDVRTPSYVNSYLQIELHKVYVISAISIQGRYGEGTGAEFAREFSVEYYRPSIGAWIPYQKGARLPGNTDTSSVATVYLDPVIFASSVRIFPYSNNTVICIRTELYGCLLGNDLISYSSVNGNLMNDTHYDGQNHQTGGLGLLVDKQNRTGFIELTSDENSKGSHFDFTFVFGSLRSFVSVEICFILEYYDYDLRYNNYFEVSLLVSLDGQHFFEVSRSKNFTAVHEYVLIDMDDWIGRFAKVQLHIFDVPPINISEIYFKTTALNLSSKQIEHIRKYVVNDKVNYIDAWLLKGSIIVIAILTAALIGITIFLCYRKKRYFLVKRGEFFR